MGKSYRQTLAQVKSLVNKDSVVKGIDVDGKVCFSRRQDKGIHR